MSKAIEVQEKQVHTLGNLTITGYNSKLSNMPFLTKRDRKDVARHIGIDVVNRPLKTFFEGSVTGRHVDEALLDVLRGCNALEALAFEALANTDEESL